MNQIPLVTVLIPARQEEADIEQCLRLVLAQDHPHDHIEIVLIDGGSTDETAAVARRVLSAGDIGWQIVDNPTGTTPSNLNAGLAVACGDVLCRIDARSLIPPHYLRVCAEVLANRPDVVVVGGAQVAVALDESARSQGIARALNNRYVMGGSRYRAGASSGPSDTVYLGSFRTCELLAAGGWDEYFQTNQDYELNRRMGRSGLIWFDDRLEVGYIPRSSLRALWRQYVRFGRWKVRYWRRTGDAPQRRQAVLLACGGGSVALACGTVGALLFAAKRETRAVAAGFLAVGCATPFMVDHLGSGGEAAALATRARAATAVVLVASGWLSGVATEAALRSTA